MTRRSGGGGQVLPLFVLALVAILAMSALLFDGANALVARRQLQNAGDAAALAGANAIQTRGTIRTCSAIAGPPPGAPRADIVAAVHASIAANLPGFPQGNVTISCPAAWGNAAVRVELRDAGTAFFSGAVLGHAIAVGTGSTAINGVVQGSTFSIVLLNPSNPSWPTGQRGCPSLTISGGPTLTFDGSIQVNSACSTANGGAMGASGGSATVTLNHPAVIRLVGGYGSTALTVNPPPLTGQPVVEDYLAGILPPIDVAALPVRSTSRLILSNQNAVLQPGVYRGGIELRNHSRAFLRPGIYVLDGGGLSVGSQASFCSVDSTATPADCSTWAADCPDGTCGVLLFNRGVQSGTGAMGSLSVGAGATLRLRAYNELATADANPAYHNLLIWQDGNPVPTSSWSQPGMSLSGGGSVQLSGTIYAPSAHLEMAGSAGGSGGTGIELTLQFITWDLTLRGNASFYFRFRQEDFIRPLDYGLVQ